MTGAFLSRSVILLLLSLLTWPPPPASAQEPVSYQEAKPSQVKALVREAVRSVKDLGIQAVIPQINDPAGPFNRGILRVFILDTESGILLADPLRPRLVGRRVLDLIDFKGKTYYKAMTKVAGGKGFGWTDHFIIPPDQKYADIEAVYVEAIPGAKALLGCGIFDMDAPTAEAQSR